MKIARTQSNGAVELHIEGRLDGFRAERLSAELSRLIRAGERRIRLDLAAVSFLGSAGIGVIVKYHQDLARQNGSLVVTLASPQAQKVLEMARLAALVVTGAGSRGCGLARAGPGSAARPALEPHMEVETLAAGARLRRRIVGEPDVLRGVAPSESRARRIRLGGTLFAVGLGAFGKDFGQCRDRFGRFLSLCGAAAYLPADGSNVPDSLTAPAEMVVLYAVLASGAFSHRLRFRAVTLGQVFEAARGALGEDFGAVVVAGTEAGGLAAAEGEGLRCAARFRALPPESAVLRASARLLFSGPPLAVGPPDAGELLLTGYCWAGGWAAAP